MSNDIAQFDSLCEKVRQALVQAPELATPVYVFATGAQRHWEHWRNRGPHAASAILPGAPANEIERRASVESYPIDGNMYRVTIRSGDLSRDIGPFALVPRAAQ